MEKTDFDFCLESFFGELEQAWMLSNPGGSFQLGSAGAKAGIHN